MYVTHDQEEALVLSDRIAVMHNGRIEQIGTPSAIYNNPASAFVARFIGQANFLTGKAVAYLAEGEATGTVTVEVNNIQIKALSLSHVLAPGSEVTLMVRPERIGIHTPNSDNSLMGKVVETTYTGQRIESVVETSVGQLKMVRLSDIKAIGETVQIGWNCDDCIVLPASKDELVK